MLNRGEWTYVARPRNGWLDIDLRELWRYRDLIALMIRRNFTVLYKQTVLGPAWAVLQPLLTTVIFTVIFGNVAKLPTDGMPPFLFYMCGNVAWSYFAGCLTGTSQTFIANAKIFGKVYFPRMAVPIATVITNLVNFAIQFAFFLCFLVYFALAGDGAVRVNWALVPLTIPALAQMALLGLGFGAIVSSLTTKYKDLQMLVSFGVQLWMYASPVAYSASLIPEAWRAAYLLNPMAPIIELYRAAFLGTGGFSMTGYLVSLPVTLAVLLLGVLLFNRIERTFMDTV